MMVMPNNALQRTDGHCGISVVRIHENQLLAFIGDARRRFKERFSEGNVREAKQHAPAAIN